MDPKEDRMTGKFLKRNAIIDTLKSAEKVNSIQARLGKERYHVDTIPCGCPDDNCGAFHLVKIDRPLPSPSEADATLLARRRASRGRNL
ncbi:MAG: hypothetical protein ACKO1O_04480 [Erythrobacter sp.]